MDNNIGLGLDQQNESEFSEGHQKSKHMETPQEQNVQASHQSPFVHSKNSPNFSLGSIKRFSLPDGKCQMTQRTNAKSYKLYSLSPVATVEFIRTQMREGSSRLPGSLEAVQKSDKTAFNNQRRDSACSSQTRYEQKRNKFSVGFGGEIKPHNNRSHSSCQGRFKDIQNIRINTDPQSMDQKSLPGSQQNGAHLGDYKHVRDKGVKSSHYNALKSRNDFMFTGTKPRVSVINNIVRQHSHRDPSSIGTSHVNYQTSLNARNKGISNTEYIHFKQTAVNSERAHRPHSAIIYNRKKIPVMISRGNQRVAGLPSGETGVASIVKEHSKLPHKNTSIYFDTAADCHDNNSRRNSTSENAPAFKFQTLAKLKQELKSEQTNNGRLTVSPQLTSVSSNYIQQSARDSGQELDHTYDVISGYGSYQTPFYRVKSPEIHRNCSDISTRQSPYPTHVGSAHCDPFQDPIKPTRNNCLREEKSSGEKSEETNTFCSLTKGNQHMLYQKDTFQPSADHALPKQAITLGTRGSSKDLASDTPKSPHGWPLDVNDVTNWPATRSQMSTRNGIIAAEPGNWYPQNNFVTSTPLRRPYTLDQGTTGSFTSIRGAEQKLQDLNFFRRSQTETIDINRSDVQPYNTRRRIQDMATEAQAAGTPVHEFDAHKFHIQNLVLQERGQLSDNTDVYKVSRMQNTNYLMTRPLTDKPFDHTPFLALNISPIIKSYTDVHMRSKPQGTKYGQTSRSAPDIGRHRARAAMLKPVNLFPEFTVSVDDNLRAAEQAVATPEQDLGILKKPRLNLNDMNSPSDMMESTFRMQCAHKKAAINTNSLHDFTQHELQAHRLVEGAGNKRFADLTSYLPTQKCTELDHRTTRYNHDIGRWENAPDFRISGNPRRFSHCPPGQTSVATGEAKGRRASLNVMRVKSADIAAIYSRLDVPTRHSSLQSRITSQQSMNSRGQVENSEKHPVYLKEFNTSYKQSHVKYQHHIPVPFSDLPYPSPGVEQDDPGRKSEARSQGPYMKKMPDSKQDDRSQHFSFEEEDFCSAEVFLKYLHTSIQNISSHISPAPEKSECTNGLQLTWAGNRQVRSSRLPVLKESKQCDAFGPWHEKNLNKAKIVVTESRRQSLPTVVHASDIAGMTPAQQHNFPSPGSCYRTQSTYNGKNSMPSQNTRLKAIYIPEDNSYTPQTCDTTDMQQPTAINQRTIRKAGNVALPCESALLKQASRKSEPWNVETDSMLRTSKTTSDLNLSGESLKHKVSHHNTLQVQDAPFADRRDGVNAEPHTQIEDKKAINISETPTPLLRSVLTTEKRDVPTRRHTVHNFLHHDHKDISGAHGLSCNHPSVQTFHSELRPEWRHQPHDELNRCWDDFSKNNFQETGNPFSAGDSPMRSLRGDDSGDPSKVVPENSGTFLESDQNLKKTEGGQISLPVSIFTQQNGHTDQTDATYHVCAKGDTFSMERQKGTVARNRNVFRGSVLISLLVESHPTHFPSRDLAYRLARKLFREGHIRSIVGAKDFEDSAQLYMWDDQDVGKSGNGGGVTSPASSNTHSPSRPEKKSHRQLDWQLIQDIRNKLLNRSEAYNIVTSYNTFFQELQQDFGYGHSTDPLKKSPQEGSDVGWSSNTVPLTSTLEHKKNTVYSTDSSLDNQTYVGKAKEIGVHRKINSKHPSVSPDSKNYLAKDASPQVSHVASPQLNQYQQQGRPIPKPRHRQNHTKYQNHHTVPEIQKVPPRVMYSEHTAVPQERFSNTKLNSEQPHLPPPDPITMDYNDGPSRQVTIGSNQRSSTNVENSNTRNIEPSDTVNGDSGTRWSQEQLIQQFQPVPSDVQRWLNAGTPHVDTTQHWNSENNRPEARGGLVGGSRSRWLESMISDGTDNGRRWPESIYSYSDNEKQLLEEMRRMKKEHQNVLRTYEGRINKLMAKMHELRNIAEMLEHSSNKSSPYGILPGKMALLKIFGGKTLDGKTVAGDSAALEIDQVPPPLPPRPGRGSRVYPNKPIIHINVTMKPLLWSRIILESDGGRQASTVWHGTTEPKIDTEELQRLFMGSSDFPSEVNLYDDICLRRGRNQAQLVSIYDAERSQRITSELRALRCTLPEVIQAFITLNCEGLHTDSFAELLELLTSPRELDKILHHAKKGGAGQLNAPEYLVFELSKVDHFIERLEFLRFKNKIQINLFEIDQQLRELQTACEEISSSVYLRHVLETVLAVGNHMNAGTDRGQADGFRVDILNSLKDIQDVSKQSNLLELVMRIYCLKFESDLDFGCPTRFRLPEPSNMRHAAQVSFEDIQRALKELKDEMSLVRNKLESLSKREGSTLTIALRVTSENFMSSAVEVLAEEQKLLDETRTQFWKTAAYFSFDGQKSTPHEFFQIWASFLHDCKYYWKLAHRNLAKAKFNTDLITKSQLSSSSLPGFNSLKSAMMKHVVSFQKDEEMRSSKSQQLQHINSWIQSVGRYTMEMQPEGVGSNVDSQDIGQYSGSLPGHTKNKLHSQQQQEFEQGPFSPPYKNQTLIESRSSMTDQKKQFEPGQEHIRTIHSNGSRYNVLEVLQAPPSPKPIKAIPPNVIKPQATVHRSHTLPTTPSTFVDHNLVNPSFSSPYQPTEPEAKSSQRHLSAHHDDNFGFEPLYESLSHYSQNHPDFQLNNISDSPQAEGVSATISSGKTVNPELDNTQRKNARFFKSLLKRDQKKSSGNEDNLQITQASPQKNVSAPFSKVKNTFVQKFSGSANTKNTNSNSQKDSNCLTQNPLDEPANNPMQVLPLDHETLSDHFSDRDTAHFGNLKGDVKEKDNVNYQNLCFPDPPRGGLNQNHTLNSLEVNPDHPDKIFYREGHESFPSTVSSLQSIRNKNRLNYHGNVLRRQDDITDHQHVFHKSSRIYICATDKPVNKNPTDSSDRRTGATNQATQARARAPIALGSNMSISDVYGNNTENVQTQTSRNHDFQSSYLESGDSIQERNSSNINGAIKASASDPKLVRTSPVPVYKAKLIPNYENQSKYDSHFEGGVRGKAEVIVPSVHIPQISISSDVYRQELQKKSEHYVGGVIYTTSGQTPTGSNNLRGSGSLGASYIILPPKSNNYPAYASTVSQTNHMVSSPVDNTGNMYPTSNNLVLSELPQNTGYNQTVQNNPENGEIISSSDYFPQQTRQGTGSLKLNIVVSSERKDEVVKGSSMPIRAEKDRKVPDSFPAHRSSSAHSILERVTEPRKWDNGVHSVYARPESQQQKGQNRVSRKDAGGKKTTPTSQRDDAAVRSAVPPSVTSLIDRFEKGADGHHTGIGLLDISDKPPSMTSTPVVRRKNQAVNVARPNHDRLAAAKSDDEISRSRSEGTKRSHSQKETGSRLQTLTTTQKEAGSNHSSRGQHFSNSKHHNVGTHYIQSDPKETDRGEKNRGEKSQVLSKPPPEQTSGFERDYIIMDCENQTQQETSDGQGDSCSRQAYIDHMLSKPSDSHPGFIKNSPRNSKNQKSNQSILLRPKPVYPEASINQHNQHYFEPIGSSHFASNQPQPVSRPDYNSIPQWHQQRQSTHVTLQTPQTYSSLPTHSNFSTASSNTAEDVRYKEDFQQNYKSSTSAFERPSKYVRQPGAMAVVKPTIMNI